MCLLLIVKVLMSLMHIVVAQIKSMHCDVITVYVNGMQLMLYF